MDNKVLIIDGNNLLHRVYWSSEYVRGIWAYPKPQNSTTYLFLNTLRSYIELFKPVKIIVCWDFREKTVENYRKLMDENYKAQRDEEKANKVYECMPIIMQLLETLGVPQINPKALEADDIIFYLSTVKFPNRSIVVTTDTDMYQLVSEELPFNVVYNPKRKREITQLFLREYYGVDNGLEFIIQKALKGDKSDNLSGIRGIRSTRIRDIINVLSNDFDLECLVPSGLLKEDELEKFKHNLKMMKFDLSMISQEEQDWYDECLDKPLNSSKEDFTVLIKDLEFWNIYKKIDYWYRLFNPVDFTDVFAQFFDIQ
jgi:5'-3' exonuclease